MKALDVALVRPVDDAVRVNEPAVPVIVQPANVARPLVVVGVLQPVREPVPEAMARLTEAAELVTVLPEESLTVTTGWVVNAVLLIAPDGWVEMTSCVAAPKVMVTDVVVEVSPVDEAVSVLLVVVPVRVHPAKVAIPPVVVSEQPVRVPVPEVTARVTVAPEFNTVLPDESSTVTAGWVVNAAPLAAPEGAVVTASLVAAP